ncbi:TetR family transcriptional regulator [Streptomonospora sediminis]
MRAKALDADAILATTEDVLRRHGPAKATVVDVARALGVSHGSVYRHFPSKAALREAVTRRWISRQHGKIAAAAEAPGAPPPERLRHWLSTVFATKRAIALDEPELFETYSALVAEHSTMAAEHSADLLAQIRAIVVDGIATGDFAGVEPDVTARAVFDATARFHHPAHTGEWLSASIDAEFDAVCSLLIEGLLTR